PHDHAGEVVEDQLGPDLAVPLETVGGGLPPQEGDTADLADEVGVGLGDALSHDRRVLGGAVTAGHGPVARPEGEGGRPEGVGPYEHLTVRLLDGENGVGDTVRG